MVEWRIEVIAYEQARLEYFKELQNKQKKRFEKFKKSRTVKELPPKERYYQILKMDEVLQYYDDIVKMLEDCDTHTNDVVQVVRCKDCTVPHNRLTGCPKLNGLVTPPDFYCSYGERR